ncbi:MAG: UvrD-helicase domain-containing protein, partial [Thioalkalispiraceae bacterium]
MKMTSKPSALTSNASVHASAGAGKTYLLVSRVVRLLLLDVAPANILAITFTRKAASEMHGRLMERLYELSTADEATLSEKILELELTNNATIKQQARLLYEKLLHSTHTIKVTTFHAFCQDLLRRFPLEADVPPGFELEDKTATLRKTAWHALMSEAAGQALGMTARSLNLLLGHVSPSQMHKLLDDFLMYRSDWWAFTQSSSQPVIDAIEKLKQQLGATEAAQPAELFRAFLADHEHELLRYMQLLGKHTIKKHTEAIEKIEQGLAHKQNPPQALSHITSALFTQSHEARSFKYNKTLGQKLGEEAAEELIHLHYQLAEVITELHKQLAIQSLLDINHAWLIAGNAYLEHYQQIKNEQRLLDFTDLEWKTYQLLNKGDNALWIQYKLDERIEHLLIDEFQDTNPTQWHLILPLLNELAAGQDERARSAFLVGDAKQSIYRFRRANPELFSQASQWLDDKLQAGRFPLNKSRRSSPAIMDFVNHVFAGFDNIDFEFERHDTYLSQLYGKVTLLPLNQEQPVDEPQAETMRNPLLAPRPEKENRGYIQEGRQLANTIRDLVQQALPIQEGDTVRPLAHKDIMILFKTRTHIQYYEQALREAGIPYLGADRGTLLESLEVNDMLNLLQWLITPYDNLALAGILKSPLFNASDDNLLQLAHSNQPDWFEALGKLVGNEQAPLPLCRAYTLLSNWLSLAGHIPVHDLLDKIFSQANVIERYKAAFPVHLAKRVQVNLTRFLELALEMDSGRYPSLTRFTSWINELKQQADDAPDAPSETGSDDRVTLMTIHAAKGLESAVVFLADSGHEIRDNLANSVIVEWPASKAQPTHFMLAHKTDFVPDFIQARFQYESKLAHREDINLFYVAATRARQYLFISASQPRSSSGLGWYGTIARQYETDISDLTYPLVLAESGEPPALTVQTQPAT